MKKVFLIGSMLLCSIMMISTPAEAQSRKDKKAAKKADWEAQQEIAAIKRQMAIDSMKAVAAKQNMRGVESDIPCIDASFDDEEYFRDYGKGTNANEQKARLAAINSAKEMVYAKLSHYVQGVMKDYTSTTQGDGTNDDVIARMENGFKGAAQRMLNDAEKVCEKSYQNNRGTWDSYYTIQISKKDLKKALQQTIVTDEELRAKVNQEVFEKATEGQFEEMMKRANK